MINPEQRQEWRRFISEENIGKAFVKDQTMLLHALRHIATKFSDELDDRDTPCECSRTACLCFGMQEDCPWCGRKLPYCPACGHHTK